MPTGICATVAIGPEAIVNRLGLAAGLAVLVAACSPPDEAGELARLIEGRWDNAAQIASGTDGDRPHLHITHHRFGNDAIPGALVYAQLNVGGPDGEIYRQRIYAFTQPDTGGVRMAAYEFADPAAFADAQSDPEELARLAGSDLVRFDPGCDFHWTRYGEVWRGQIHEGDCVRTSRRSGRDMIIMAEFSISGDRFTHSESGRYADTGEWAFRPTNDIANDYDRYEAAE